MSGGATATVLGVDTSLRSTGVAVVRQTGSRLESVEHGTIATSRKHPLSACLVRLHDGIRDIIARTQPDGVAIEGAFFHKNAKTAMILGEARGVVIAACASAGLPVYEYAPRRVKQAVVGTGTAGKDQVRQMVMAILAIREEPQEDASDALAIAVCHLHNRSGHRALAPKAI